MANEHIFTVSELTREIAFSLEDKYPGIWVEGEISNFTRSSSGHCYFSLKDEDSTLKCVMFKSSSARTKFSPEDGLSALCYGKIGVYNKQGQYQLYVDRIEPRGKGALYMAFEQLKEKLNKEGLFSEERKRPIPLFPSRVAVVTSPTGAAIRDIITVARRRNPDIEITVYPVMVQGDGAKEEIASAIALLNEYNEKVAKKKPGENPIDVMIVGRGGGSLEDLWAFNEEVVARAISASAIPVVSAVGHEIDFTISDFVADKRAPTPSAAAEMIVADKKEMISMVENLLGRMLARAKSIVGSKEAELLRLKEAYVLREPVNFILQLKQEIDGLERRIVKGMESLMAGKHNLYDVLKGKLRMLDPESVLERGYSITFRDSRVVKNASDLKSGDRIFTKFARGESGSVVE